MGHISQVFGSVVEELELDVLYDVLYYVICKREGTLHVTAMENLALHQMTHLENLRFSQVPQGRPCSRKGSTASRNRRCTSIYPTALIEAGDIRQWHRSNLFWDRFRS